MRTNMELISFIINSSYIFSQNGLMSSSFAHTIIFCVQILSFCVNTSQNFHSRNILRRPASECLPLLKTWCVLPVKYCPFRLFQIDPQISPSGKQDHCKCGDRVCVIPLRSIVFYLAQYLNQ